MTLSSIINGRFFFPQDITEGCHRAKKLDFNISRKYCITLLLPSCRLQEIKYPKAFQVLFWPKRGCLHILVGRQWISLGICAWRAHNAVLSQQVSQNLILGLPVFHLQTTRVNTLIFLVHRQVIKLTKSCNYFFWPLIRISYILKNLVIRPDRQH